MKWKVPAALIGLALVVVGGGLMLANGKDAPQETEGASGEGLTFMQNAFSPGNQDFTFALLTFALLVLIMALLAYNAVKLRRLEAAENKEEKLGKKGRDDRRP